MSSTELARVSTAAGLAPDAAALLVALEDSRDRPGRDQLIAWLHELGPSDLPDDPPSWPCLLCDAAPGEPCVAGDLERSAEWFHSGRGFDIGFTQPGRSDEVGWAEDPTDVCTPTVETGPGRSYRGRCLGCGWRGAVVDSENDAVELAHDHTHSGWRDLPVIDAWPKTNNTTARPAQLEKLLARWDDENLELLPEGWLDTGGPIVVHRFGDGTRHVPGRAPGGGYELAAGGLVTTDDPVAPGTDIVPVASTDVDTSPAPWESPAAVFEQRLFHEDGDMPKDLARQVVAKVGAYSVVVYRLLGRAHERRIWKALGYNSWAAFVAAEFDVSKSRAYQLVHQYQANVALGAGADMAEARALLPGERPTISEAQARPMGTLASDERAVKQIWARATVLAGGDEPTAAQVEEAVREYRNPREFVPPAEPLVDEDLAVWSSGPVRWLWQTPPAGTVLYVGVGQPGEYSEMVESSVFVSPPRLGDVDEIRRMDAGGLLPWVIAELLTGDVPPVEAAAAIADLELAYLDRGPYLLDRDDAVAAVAEGPAVGWEDAAAPSPVEEAIEAFDTAIAEYEADKTPATRARVAATREAAADAIAALSDYADEAHSAVSRAADRFHAELDENGPYKNDEDLHSGRFDQFDRELLLALDPDGELPPALGDRILEHDFVSFTRRSDLPAKHVPHKLLVEDILDAYVRSDPDFFFDPTTAEDEEVLTGELVDRSAPEPSPPGGSAAAAGAGGGGDVPPASPSPAPPSPEQVALAALRQEIPRMDVDELLELVGMAIGSADGSTDPADARWAAQVLRLAASRFETDAVRLDREGAA